jgi:hypothetical protein
MKHPWKGIPIDLTRVGGPSLGADPSKWPPCRDCGKTPAGGYHLFQDGTTQCVNRRTCYRRMEGANRA